MKRSYLKSIRSKTLLLLFMIFVGVFTVYASANTYEVASGYDVPFTSVIKRIGLSQDDKIDASYKVGLSASYDEGSFGIPQKIKFPESNQHLDIFKAKLQQDEWLASQGVAHTFLTSSERQKVFGSAVIYLRYNTPTTQYLGEILTDDVINIVTTKGWQFGYQVTDVTDDPRLLPSGVKVDTSQIIVVLINDHDASIKSFQASLVKVGERI